MPLLKDGLLNRSKPSIIGKPQEIEITNQKVTSVESDCPAAVNLANYANKVRSGSGNDRASTEPRIEMAAAATRSLWLAVLTSRLQFRPIQGQMSVKVRTKIPFNHRHK